ncbi:MAG TPA: SDR family oxidoreductase [Terracidiphilus sp.]|nr:SDR family oxidoreductase [Terracidiphilus sp.]
MASVLITGTSKGIGLETALAFARAGHTVFATKRNPSGAPQLGEIAAREKLPIHISTMDVNSDDSVAAGIKAILAVHGSIDVLVNNAGIERAGSVEELPFADFRACMETNYFGMLRCMQALVPSMRQRRSGCIINITSISGRLAGPPLTPYMASKWAAEALCEGLAGELKSFNIRVAIVEPGIIDTSMARRISENENQSPYPHVARFVQMFQSSLQNPVPPSLVAEKILEIAESGTWQLRHLVGPDAEPFIQWRKSMSDEEWIDLNAADNETFFARLQQAFAPEPAESH